MGRTAPWALGEYIQEDGRYPNPRASEQDRMRDLKTKYWPDDMLKRYNEGCRHWISNLPDIQQPLSEADVMRMPPPPPAEPPVGPEPFFLGPPSWIAAGRREQN